MEVSFTKLFSVFLKKWYFVLAIALIVAILAYSGSLLLHNDSYTATATVLLAPSASSDNTSLNSNTTTALQNIITTYIQFFKEEAILESVRAAYPQEYEASFIRSYLIENPTATQEQAKAVFAQRYPQGISMTYSNADIQNATQITQKGDTESLIFTIRVTLSQPQDAIVVANTLAAQSEQIKTYLPFCEGRIVTPAATARKNEANAFRYSLIAFAGGLVISYLAFFIYDLFNKTISTKQDLKETTDLPIFGSIPLLVKTQTKDLTQSLPDDGKLEESSLPENASQILIREAYFAMRAKLMYHFSDLDKQNILFTSALSSEGKSTTIANTAIVFAKTGKKVLLIDADFYHSSQKSLFELKEGTGLSEFLSKKATLPAIIQETSYENLNVISSGAIPPNPAELLMRDEMDQIFEELDSQYDYIFVDAPPAYMIQDASVLAPKLAATIMIVSANMTKSSVFNETMGALESAGGKVLGTIWKEPLPAHISMQPFRNYSDYLQYYNETDPFHFISESI